MENFTCVICNNEIKNEYGCNPYPVVSEGVCCKECDNSVVITARLNQLEANDF